MAVLPPAYMLLGHRRDRRRATGSTRSRWRGCTSRSASGSGCRCWSHGSWRCRATTAGRRWPGPRCATTCTPCTPSSPPRCCATTAADDAGAGADRGLGGRATASWSAARRRRCEEICADDDGRPGPALGRAARRAGAARHRLTPARQCDAGPRAECTDDGLRTAPRRTGRPSPRTELTGRIASGGEATAPSRWSRRRWRGSPSATRRSTPSPVVLADEARAEAAERDARAGRRRGAGPAARRTGRDQGGDRRRRLRDDVRRRRATARRSPPTARSYAGSARPAR